MTNKLKVLLLLLNCSIIILVIIMNVFGIWHTCVQAASPTPSGAKSVTREKQTIVNSTLLSIELLPNHCVER